MSSGEYAPNDSSLMMQTTDARVSFTNDCWVSHEATDFNSAIGQVADSLHWTKIHEYVYSIFSEELPWIRYIKSPIIIIMRELSSVQYHIAMYVLTDAREAVEEAIFTYGCNANKRRIQTIQSFQTHSFLPASKTWLHSILELRTQP